MIRAYDEMYLRNARSLLADSIDYATYTEGYDPSEYYNMFIKCDIARKYEKGDPFTISGMSGTELALRVIEKYTGEYNPKERILYSGRSREYWAGWAIAYYQWYSACSLIMLEELIPFDTILLMYDKYHEMDIMHFVDKIEEIRAGKRLNSYLKMYRERMGLSQSELAHITGIPIKTLQHYEQGTKSLAKANASYVLALAKTIGCRPEELCSIP